MTVPDCRVIEGDCPAIMPTLEGGSFDCVATDPPYEIGFMGKRWDGTGVAFDPATWAAAMRTCKPGAYLLAFGGTRTYHRLTCAIEDAGWEVRDCLLWLYGTGYPKGQGCLKPAYEPIVLARKPGPKVLPLGVEACRVPTRPEQPGSTPPSGVNGRRGSMAGPMGRVSYDDTNGRYPANVAHDGSGEVIEAFAAFGDRASHDTQCDGSEYAHNKPSGIGMFASQKQRRPPGRGDTGTVARFFYCAKASKAERGEGNSHPTVKPLAIMRWLVRLVCPPGGTVLDPFFGSGTTGVAALKEGRSCVGIEQWPEYAAIARKRIADTVPPLFAEAT